ncbi:Hypothetical protein NTJ_00900 [Nesidiocoris tenuis]|uniref:Uncharacterized protein n=1 Tax=Nesidiocoris tenuis TaxID=355587 RepID=A0ABN7AAC1_9HEMI|nr:Hypothetical protein NTJ_00900 [Nesidiocoris tenuis]
MDESAIIENKRTRSTEIRDFLSRRGTDILPTLVPTTATQSRRHLDDNGGSRHKVFAPSTAPGRICLYSRSEDEVWSVPGSAGIEFAQWPIYPRFDL